MRRDFIYCPECSRYSIVHWRAEKGQWECEDCMHDIPGEAETSWTTPETLAS